MKNKNTYIIISVLLLAIAIVGSTYAFFFATTSQTNQVATGATKLKVIYTGQTRIDGSGTMNIGLTKDDGINRTVNIAVSEDSVEANATIYINIEEITSNLRIKGLIWEVYGLQNGKEVYSDVGDFYGYDDTTNNIVEIVKDYRITKDNTEFTVYLWIDGNLTNNNVIGGSFKGFIGARTENVSGQIK